MKVNFFFQIQGKNHALVRLQGYVLSPSIFTVYEMMKVSLTEILCSFHLIY